MNVPLFLETISIVLLKMLPNQYLEEFDKKTLFLLFQRKNLYCKKEKQHKGVF